MKILREFREEDSDYLFKWINDRDLVLLNSPYKPITRHNHEEWLKGIIKGSSDSYHFIIKNQPDIEHSHPIGSCSIRNIDHTSRSGELQIRIGEETNRGKGIGAQAVLELCRFGFNDLNLNRIYLDVFTTNTRAIQCYKKCGFIGEGVKRKACFVDGDYVDIAIMSIIRAEFNG